MKIKYITDERYQDYKKPAMLIAFPNCSFKCEQECGERVCQNGALARYPASDISEQEVCERYLSNPITQAIVCGGLEPFDSFCEVYSLIATLRYTYNCHDDVVVFTGYTEEECMNMGWLQKLSSLGNIIIKFGRFIPNQAPHFDEVLGTNLASDNQYAEVIT